MGEKNNTFQKKISQTEKEIIIIKGEKVEKSEDSICIKFDVKANDNNDINLKDKKNKIYYEVYAPDKILFRSECFNEKGHFLPVNIPLNLFKNQNIKISFIQKTNNLLENCNLNINEFLNKKEFNMKSYQISSNSRKTKNYTFMDYLKAGIEIGLSVAIDFTSSNGNINEITSLHYIDKNKPNQYERAIKACGNIIEPYDNDKLFPCFGFGAKINNIITPIFNLNFQKDPNVKYINGIIDAYHKALKKVELWGPTHFSPIIKKMNKIIKEQNNKFKYHILMILTDGIIEDIGDTKDELVEGSFLPLSVIIIGVGNADFSNMNVLDADNDPLVNSEGVKSVRDLVQFVPFLKYESNPENLAIEVLEEVPRQIVEYYEQNNLDPDNMRS